MADATTISTNFTSGELSPRLIGRVDQSRYYNGVAILENMIVHPHGGITRRPGFRFVYETKDSSKKSRLIPFIYSDEETYQLEFGNQYIRFFRQGAVVGAPVEVSTPYLESGLNNINFTQSADIVFLVDGTNRPKELQRLTPTTFQLVDYDFQDGPYLDLNETTTTLTPAATTGPNITITASAVTGINGGSGFLSTDVGRLIRISNPASGEDWGWAKIVAVDSTTVVRVDIKSGFSTTSATTNWRLGSWSDTTGWPKVVQFFQQRVLFACTDTDPQGLWASASGNFNDMAPTEKDGSIAQNNAVAFIIASRKVNTLKWMEQINRALAIGGSGAEFALNRGLAMEILSFDNILISPETAFGSSNEGKVVAAQANNAVLYIQKDAKKLRQYIFSVQRDGFLSTDLTLLAEHITGDGVIDMAFQQNPDSIIWLVRKDGALLGLTYEPDQEVFAWHRHPMTGTDIEVESIAVIPEQTVKSDELWAIVKRTINGSTKRYIERMEQPFRATYDDDGDVTNQSDVYYVDSGITVTGTDLTTITGLDHLEGEEVQIVVDGAAHPNKVVASGQIELDNPADKVHVGLGYTSKIKELPLFLQGQTPIMGKRKRIHRIHVNLWETLGLKYGTTEDNLIPYSFRTGEHNMDQAPPLFSGIISPRPEGTWGDNPALILVQDQPLPLTILATEKEITVNAR